MRKRRTKCATKLNRLKPCMSQNGLVKTLKACADMAVMSLTFILRLAVTPDGKTKQPVF